MASTDLSTSSRRRGSIAAILTLLLFFAEQSLLAETLQAPSIPAIAPTFTIGGGAQWLLTIAVLVVSWAFFFAVVRGIRSPQN